MATRRTPEPVTKQQLLGELQARIGELTRAEQELGREEARLFEAGVRIPVSAPPPPDESERLIAEKMNGFYVSLPGFDLSASPAGRLATIQLERQHTRAALDRLSNQEMQVRAAAFGEAWSNGMSSEWATCIREGATLVAGLAAWERKRDAIRDRARQLGDAPFLPADRNLPLLRGDYRKFLEDAVSLGVVPREVLP
jgi:hypothetical protein